MHWMADSKMIEWKGEWREQRTRIKSLFKRIEKKNVESILKLFIKISCIIILNNWVFGFLFEMNKS